jgi:hypothetical protein
MKDTTDATAPKDVFSTHIMTGVDKLHNEGYYGKGIKIGIIDSGVDYNHPALGGKFGPGNKVIGGYDFVGDDYTGNPGTPPPAPDNDVSFNTLIQHYLTYHHHSLLTNAMDTVLMSLASLVPTPTISGIFPVLHTSRKSTHTVSLVVMGLFLTIFSSTRCFAPTRMVTISLHYLSAALMAGPRLFLVLLPVELPTRVESLPLLPETTASMALGTPLARVPVSVSSPLVLSTSELARFFARLSS